MALIVLNRYLDIAEAIEDGLPHMHLEQVQGGNLPGKLPLPQNQSLTVTQRAEVHYLCSGNKRGQDNSQHCCCVSLSF